MSRVSRRSLSRSAIAAYLCICVALLVLLALTMYGSYRDMQFLRITLLEAEIDHLRSHAERAVGRIERDLEVHNATSLDELDQSGWLRLNWQRTFANEERSVYAAVVDNNGRVLMHSDSAHQGQRLSGNWYERVLVGFDEDVVETRNPVLTLGEWSFDVRLPIEIGRHEVGEYHAGFDVNWFETWAAEKQSEFLWRRSLLVGAVLLIVLLSTTSLFYIATHSLTLRRAVDSASLERATEVGKLAAGLAHEIRNPLHAIQLNLHTFRRSHERQVEMPPDEMSRLLEQSTREVARIEHLMRELVGFAAPDEPRDEVIDLTTEIHDVVDFIQQEMLDKKVEIQTQLPGNPVYVRMDRGRLRQIMLNLLQNAQQAMKQGGRIDVRLAVRRSRAEIAIADNGPGIPEQDHLRIFEPFYSTKADGVGLGLALVKHFTEQVGGQIRCENNPTGGVTFWITLNEAKSTNS